jgi:gephyrin
LTTGDELLTPGHKTVEGKIYDSNTTLLVALLEQFGFEAACTKIVKDSYDALRDAVSDAHNYQFVISTGGVSMGDKDYVKQVLDDLKYDIKFGRVNLKPG